MYRQGPFRKAKAEYGYQLPLTPRQFFEAGIVAVNAWTRKLHGKDFDRLAAKERDDALKALEQGKAELGDFDGKPFFEALLQITMEGFFADPIYGGNRNKVSWKMVGFRPAGGLRQPDRGVPHQALRRRTAVDRRFFVREADMATRLKEVDAVMVGMGWTGSIMARELTKAGLTVIGLERARRTSRRASISPCPTCATSSNTRSGWS